MKLKKIASLLLAGVMAASMLAGCQNTSVNPDPTPNPNPAPSTGYSDMVGKNLAPDAASKVDMVDSTDLDDALKSAMSYVAGSSIASAYNWNLIRTLKCVNWGTNFVSNDEMLEAALADMIDSMDAENAVSAAINTTFDVLDPYVNTDEQRRDDDRNITLMYVIDGKVGYDSVMKQVASQLSHEILALKTDYRVGGINTVLDYNYDVSVSADTITLDADHGKSVTVVAVNVARILGEG